MGAARHLGDGTTSGHAGLLLLQAIRVEGGHARKQSRAFAKPTAAKGDSGRRLSWTRWRTLRGPRRADEHRAAAPGRAAAARVPTGPVAGKRARAPHAVVVRELGAGGDVADGLEENAAAVVERVAVGVARVVHEPGGAAADPCVDHG